MAKRYFTRAYSVAGVTGGSVTIHSTWCADCGAQISLREVHDKFHDQIDRLQNGVNA